MPRIKPKRRSRLIPEYSLTGDLLSYLRCAKQYRYQKKAGWQSTNPVQIWFGEFLHKMMARGYRLYQQDPDRSLQSYDWQVDLRPIEMEIVAQLDSVGIYAPSRQFCRYDENTTGQRGCGDTNHPHKTLPSQRAEESIKIIGNVIYPYISNVEKRLKGLQELPDYDQGVDRANFFGLTGVVDVITSVNLLEAGPYDPLMMLVNSVLQENDLTEEFEIIIEYKGSRRPTTDYDEDPTGLHHEWQVYEYAWLRENQQETNLPVKIGIVIYINELVPSKDDMFALRQEIQNGTTDIIPTNPNDLERVQNYRSGQDVPPLSARFRGNRAIKAFSIDPQEVTTALQNFASIVRQIEDYMNEEYIGAIPLETWPGNVKERYCTICNLKTFCQDIRENQQVAGDVGIEPNIPPQI